MNVEYPMGTLPAALAASLMMPVHPMHRYLGVDEVISATQVVPLSGGADALTLSC